jgi:outer membrane protein assembly factor BamB
MTQADEPRPEKLLRLWPGVVAVALQWLVRFGVPIIAPDALYFCVFGGLFGGLAIVVWWAFLSRAPRFERWGAIVLMTVALGATSRVLHASIATGMMGMMYLIFAIPVLSLAFVVWAVASRSLSDGPRRVTMVATILLACGVWALLRTNGITGEAASDFAWRWTATAEERLLANASDKLTAIPPAPAAVKTPGEQVATRAGEEPTAILPAPAVAKTSAERVATQAGGEPTAHEPAAAAAKTGAEWPGFRGPHRDGIIPGVRIVTDWSASPPVELWRRPIGPGWSSFAVHGDLLYTQE